VLRLALDAPLWAPPAFGIELTLALVDNANVAPPGQHAYAAPAVSRAAPPRKYRPLPTTPAAEFDLALLVPNEIAAATVDATIRRAAGTLLEQLVLFDEFRGAGVPPDSRSLAWRLTFRDPSRTLRDAEIEGRRQKILRTLESELGVRHRTA
jgi:phenylalanyl-tRNA synthetase beta chain